MPAFRSRTLHWRRNLEQLARRGGALEVAIAPASDVADSSDPPSTGPLPADFVWRLRIASTSEDRIELELPEMLHRSVPVREGTTVVAAIVVGPNRWMFRSRVVASVDAMSIGASPGTFQIEMPEKVARTRRRHLRVDSASLALPTVRLWPLLDLASVRPAQRALALTAEAIGRGERVVDRTWEDESVRPTLGPEFGATLMNIGGGGAGLRLEPSDAAAIASHRHFWMEIDLRPESALPLCVTARIAHTHLESTGATYAGVAFDFTADAEHAKLVGRQVIGAIAARQRRQEPATRRAA
ncbi:MAG: hypothetical protein ACO3YY_01425 [Phycisphaerales bacterium]|jgi:hypothetical protein